ncbi:MAG: helix-turn-helix domain-containing protein [Bacteroidales bacterium]|jgi:transcriptional regulator with XRE-family HTH domain|nr:helix-turn-helix domain-containing protein [Bacteroidales bacterium]
MRLWLRELRGKAGMSQTEIANLVGIDVTSIGKYENGKRRPSIEVAKKIAALLNFDWTLFFADKENTG